MGRAGGPAGTTRPRHDAFLKHCATAGRLAAAGRKYRERLDAYPEDPVAAQMQARIVGMATAALAPIRAAAGGREPQPLVLVGGGGLRGRRACWPGCSSAWR